MQFFRQPIRDNEKRNETDPVNACCFICNAVMRKFCMHLHHKRCHFAIDETYECFDFNCNFKTSQKYDLQGHIQFNRAHTLKRNDIDREVKVRCYVCNAEMQKQHMPKHYKRQHLASEAIFECFSCEFQTPLKNGLHRHFLQTHSGWLPYQCYQCAHAVSFHQKAGLSAHAGRHLEKKIPKCQQCAKTFSSHSALVVHERRHSTGYKRRQCPICKKFVANYTAHQRLHGTSRPHQCPTCKRAFAQSSNMKAHYEWTHSEATKCQCHFCGRTFEKLPYLSDHMRRKHGNSDRAQERKRQLFECKVCKKTYATKSSAQSHEKGHKEQLQCDWCDKVFSAYDSNRIFLHMMIHLKQKPHHCSKCGKAFVQKANLQKHISVRHDERKKYLCKICEKIFTSAVCCARHERDNHRGSDPRVLPVCVCDLCDANFMAQSSLYRHLFSKSDHFADQI